MPRLCGRIRICSVGLGDANTKRGPAVDISFEAPLQPVDKRDTQIAGITLARRALPEMSATLRF
jgi:hypothetical protein